MMRIAGVGIRSVFHASLRLPGLYSPADVPGGHAPVDLPPCRQSFITRVPRG